MITRALFNLKWSPRAFFTILAAGMLGVGCIEDPDIVNMETDRSQYLGTWEVTESEGFSAPQKYSLVISADTGAKGIILEGLYNIPGTRVRASVQGRDLNIPNQESEGIQFFGYGKASAAFDRIDLNFTANDGSGPDQVEARALP